MTNVRPPTPKTPTEWAAQIVSAWLEESEGMSKLMQIAHLGILLAYGIADAQAEVQGAVGRETHNVWTIYGLNPDGSDAEQPVVEFNRPQDWGHPRWTYHQFRFAWLTAEEPFTALVHCYTDLTIPPNDVIEVFGPLVLQAVLPGLPAWKCGREELAEDDMWDEAWGPIPPIHEEDLDDDYDPERDEEPE